MSSKRRAYGTISAALIVGLAFGAAEGCVTSEPLASVPPDEVVDAQGTQVEVASRELSTEPSEPERPPPWSPPDEPILDGVDGAAQLLARGQAEAALEQLEAANKLDTVEGEAALEPESREWFLAGAIAGRAYMQTGQWELAVLALEPLAASKKFADMLPRDIVGYELARARTAWATAGGLDPTTADIQLRKAVRELGKLKGAKPNRIQAALRVAQGEAMVAIAGADKRSRKTAAKKADQALERLISSFPNHAEVGEWMLERALAKERAGQTSEAAAALRQVSIDRAGEPEAARAWAELERLAAEHDKIEARPLDTAERLAAGQAARILRRIERSKELLEGVWNDPEQPRHRHREAGHSLGWTYYKAREYSRCADVLNELYADVRSMSTRNDLSRCLERAGRYDELIQLWVEVYDGNKRASGSTALWNAIELAVNGGEYQRASELLAEFETRFKGHGSERRWLRAWLPMRLGQDDEARDAFTQLLDSGRTGGRERAITYFLAKLELRSDDPEIRQQGVARLRGLVDTAYQRIAANGVIGGHPIYYGLMARQRLLEAGEDPGEPPRVEPIEHTQPWIGHRETLALLAKMAAEHGDSFSSLVRAEQLFAAGWHEEASREVRMAADEFINGASVYGGSSMPGTRSEALVAGLAWAPEWRQPVATAGRNARKAMRDEDYRAVLNADFSRLTWAMNEPYRFGKLSSSGEPYRARWHLRAYREPIERHAWEREVDPHHLWALMYTESRYRRHVVSYVGARGALQIMPWTGRQLVEDLGEIERGERFDPDILFLIEDNSRLATYYISELLTKFHGQPAFAYASYNGGPNNVARWLAAKSQGPTGVGLDEFIEEIPFQESARYARRVMEVHATYDLLYRGSLPTWTNEVDPVFEDNIDY
ncbi:lytic transglycosylase domain-containing protein [Enhygromyxa salina]|uniref:lytic transglycosylase domain-containing protein n=1 Tax=Enhygromyxa salina TaxID=215803 RepID=UPI000D08E890|nr:lytic transglycosylase domain-containing protein [Enhygromyxa salina]